MTDPCFVGENVYRVVHFSDVTPHKSTSRSRCLIGGEGVKACCCLAFLRCRGHSTVRVESSEYNTVRVRVHAYARDPTCLSFIRALQFTIAVLLELCNVHCTVAVCQHVRNSALSPILSTR